MKISLNQEEGYKENGGNFIWFILEQDREAYFRWLYPQISLNQEEETERVFFEVLIDENVYF